MDNVYIESVVVALAPRVKAFLLKCADGSAVIEDALIEK